MDNKEFADFRKTLHKTQKELSMLLGVSLKAVCSYEQGWRTIPGHVERQLLFLMVKKKSSHSGVDNCWEIKNCPEERMKQCPAWEFSSGDLCWFIGGTLCDNTTTMKWKEKIETCKKCVVMKKITAPVYS